MQANATEQDQPGVDKKFFFASSQFYSLKPLRHILAPHPAERIADLSQRDVILHALNEDGHFNQDPSPDASHLRLVREDNRADHQFSLSGNFYRR